jgi:signal transduction histidine kinase/ligand-binding sensor domain-containing protein/DNA-binding NarL/FixJ family response regulator
MKIKSLFLLIALSICQMSEAGAKFYSINSLYGIPLRETSSLCRDKDGFLWATSKTGIIRLTNDDYRFYQLPYKSTNYNITRLIYHPTGLIAYTNNGQLFRYNRIYDRFDFIDDLRLNENSLSIFNLLIDKNGAFWIATSLGLYRYSDGVLSPIGKQKTPVQSIEWHSSEKLIVATVSDIRLININSPQKSTLISRNPNSLFQVLKLYYDQQSKKIWIGTVSNGLYYSDLRRKVITKVCDKILPQQPMRAIEANTDSTLMVGIDGQGIWEITKKGKVLNVYKEDADDSHSLRGDGVYDIFCDQNKRVWIGTYSGGISFFDQSTPLIKQITHRVNNSNSLCNNFINKIIEDHNGNIWFATNNGICKWDQRNDRWSTYYHNKKEQAQVFLSVNEDALGRIWAGTYSSGIYIIDGKSGKELAHFYQYDGKSSLSTDFILDLFRDAENNMWIGGVPGNIISFQAKDKKFRIYNGRPINTFKQLNSNQIILVCSFGLVLLDKTTGSENILFDGSWLNDAVVDGENIWVCSRGEGLLCINLKSKKIKKFTTKQGLPSNYINSVVKVNENLWLGTETGLCKFNIKSNLVLTYSSLFSVSKIAYNPNSRCQLRNGDIIWGTNDGAVMFNPKDVQESKSQGKIFFQDFFISGRSIKEVESIQSQFKCPLDSLQEITLNYNQNNISLEMLPLRSTSTDSKFSWQMLGLDAEWTLPTTQRIITYTNLPSGHLTLKIRMYDSSMSYVVSERVIFIRITPPFWKSWWFISLLFALAFVVVYLALRYYINNLKQLHAEEKIRFFTNTAHDIRTSLTLINAPVEELKNESNLSETGNYYVRLVTEQVKRLSMVVTQLMDFQKIDIGKEQIKFKMVDIVQLVSLQKVMFDSLANSKDVEIIFNSNEESYFSAVDELMIEKAVGNLISNAIKYSIKNGIVNIDLICSLAGWKLEVIDKGIGISLSAQQQLFKEFYRGDNAINSKVIGSGIGLLLVKKYVEMHDGTVEFESKENIGSCFKLNIPYKKVEFPAEVVGNVFSDVNYSLNEIEIFDQMSLSDGGQLNDMKILVVEDNDDLRNFIIRRLGVEFDVSVAEDGRQAWDVIRKEMPDLVVSDVMMPNMDGFKLCELMKSTYETSHIPIILLTALSDKTEHLRGLGLGADDYLTKPFDMSLLIQRIKSVVRNRILVRTKALNLINRNDNIPILANDNNDKFVRKAVDVVWKNISDSQFGKDEFAAAMNVSTSLLYKKIKSLTDQSPVDFMKSIRLNYSLELLRSKNYTVTEVSEMCGFASIGYFSTVFRKYFGKSPSELD